MEWTTEVFLFYIAYKKHCAREVMTPVSYAAWLWLRGVSDQRPW